MENLIKLFQAFLDANSLPLDDVTISTAPVTRGYLRHSDIPTDEPIRITKGASYVLPKYRCIAIDGEDAPCKVQIIYGGDIVPAGLNDKGQELYKWDKVHIVNIDIIAANGTLHTAGATIEETLELL